ncbi:MAG: DUF4202 domain-containing protein [Deltaproteobacteria bacterium]|nr:DUF4202 domain-containing protein [Deltaproteobacteria bacterium]
MRDSRFEVAIGAFDAANGADPTSLLVDGVARPRALVVADRLEAWVVRLAPDAADTLRLAARSQHVRRWEFPRAAYPEGRLGYLEWRKAAARFHAAQVTEILRGAGYSDAETALVTRITLKQGIKVTPEVQLMEDALCLSFLEHEAEEFAGTQPFEKVVDVLAKTWRKMSPAGHAVALSLPLPAPVRAAVEAALAALPGASVP